MAFITIMGARWIVREARAKVFCNCGHEFNEHWVIPAGYRVVEAPKTEACKVCNCKRFKKNPADKKNSPPVKFW